MTQQSTLGDFGCHKNVRSERGRWLRENSPEHVAFGPRCTECGARFKTVQALASHRRWIHDYQAAQAAFADCGAAGETPHWAWHFLQGSEPVQVIDGDEATPSLLT